MCTLQEYYDFIDKGLFDCESKYELNDSIKEVSKCFITKERPRKSYNV